MITNYVPRGMGLFDGRWDQALYDGAQPVPVFSRYDYDARIYTTSYKDGVPGFRLVVVCCGPDAPLPNPVEWMRMAMTSVVVHYADDEMPVPICTIGKPDVKLPGVMRVTFEPADVTCSQCFRLMTGDTSGHSESQNVLRNSDENPDRFFSERGRPVDPRPSTSFSRPVPEKISEGADSISPTISAYAESAPEDESGMHWCPRCGSGRWVGARYGGPDSPRFAQCVPCGARGDRIGSDETRPRNGDES